MTDNEIEAFLTEVKEAKRYRDDLEIVSPDLLPTELVARMTNLPLARQRAKELENRLKETLHNSQKFVPAASQI